MAGCKGGCSLCQAVYFLYSCTACLEAEGGREGAIMGGGGTCLLCIPGVMHREAELECTVLAGVREVATLGPV